MGKGFKVLLRILDRELAGGGCHQSRDYFFNESPVTGEGYAAFFIPVSAVYQQTALCVEIAADSLIDLINNRVGRKFVNIIFWQAILIELLDILHQLHNAAVVMRVKPLPDVCSLLAFTEPKEVPGKAAMFIGHAVTVENHPGKTQREIIETFRFVCQHYDRMLFTVALAHRA